MNSLDKQYIALLQDILDNGVTKQDRTGTGTLSVFGRQIRHKMSEGFPLLTTKKMPFRLIATELMWFLRGDTNIKYLVDNDCHIWNGDAYKAYLKKYEKDKLHGVIYENDETQNRPFSKEEFINWIKNNDKFSELYGELGPVYGKQWRRWKGKLVDKSKEFDAHTAWVPEQIDQIANLINDLKTNPDSRRLMVSAWNVGELDSMTLPPCHYGFQTYTRELSLEERQTILEKRGYKGLLHSNVKNYKSHKKILDVIKQTCDDVTIPTRAISLMWNQRSVDTFLGLPFNIASYGLLLEIIAKEVNMVPDELIGNLGDTHLYLNHVEQAKEQIGRELSAKERTALGSNGSTRLYDCIKEGNYITIDADVEMHEVCDAVGIPKRTREPYPLPKLIIDQFDETNHYIGDMDDISEYNVAQFKLENYQSHSAIKAPLSN